jgi:type II secretory pathway component GspD/PulD (secretin)
VVALIGIIGKPLSYYLVYNIPMMQNIYLLIILLLFVQPGTAAESILQVIPLENRPASEIQPLIQPFLDSSDRIIADGSRLIVRTTPERFEEIRNIIATLDTRLQNLLISVFQGRNISAEELNARASVHVKVPLNKPSDTKVRVNGHYYQTRNRDAVDSTQKIRTLEGRPAYIQTGELHQLQNVQSYYPDYGYPSLYSSTELIATTTGFAVTPRLTGEQVIIEISPWSDKLKINDQIETQSAMTTIRTKLGEWVEIGRVTEESDLQEDGWTAKVRRTKRDNLHILIKVEKVQ